MLLSWKAPLWAVVQPCRIAAPSSCRAAGVQLEQKGCTFLVAMEGSVPAIGTDKRYRFAYMQPRP